MRTLNTLNTQQKSPESADYSKAELSYARAFARTMQVWIRDVFTASRSTAAPTIHVTSWQTLKFSTGALAQDTVVIDGGLFLGEHIPERFLAGHLHSRHCGHGNVSLARQRPLPSRIGSAASISVAGTRTARTSLTGTVRANRVSWGRTRL
jgi:hypothetical protein